MKYFAAALLLLLLTNCSTKKLAYFQDSEKYVSPVTDDDTIKFDERILQPFDVIKITIKTPDPELNMLISPPEGSSSRQEGTSLDGYMVDANGYIQLPRLGSIYVTNLTPKDLENAITDILKEFVSDPYVNVQVLNFKISVFGEVNRPGVISMPVQSHTLLDALGLAGDITQYGNRNQVKVIRQSDEEAQVFYLDLTTVDVFKQSGFQLKPGDIVYVEPLKRKAFAVISPALSTGFSLLSVTATLLNIYIQSRR